jgi:hypothetical protein
MPRLLDAFRTHLVAQGAVRVPRIAGAAPPLWLQPRQGAPAPGERPANGTDTEIGPDVVAAADISGGFPTGRFQSAWRFPIVEVRIRSRTAPLGEDLEAAITAAVIDRTNWTMGGLQVIESRHWRALTPVASDEQSFDFLVAYAFEIYV